MSVIFDNLRLLQKLAGEIRRGKKSESLPALVAFHFQVLDHFGKFGLGTHDRPAYYAFLEEKGLVLNFEQTTTDRLVELGFKRKAPENTADRVSRSALGNPFASVETFFFG